MNVLVINLPESTKRVELLRARLQSLGIPFQVHPASKGSLLSRAAYPGSEALRSNELGGAVSHYQVYKKIAEHPEKVACVLEDDVRPPRTLTQVIHYFESNPRLRAL